MRQAFMELSFVQPDHAALLQGAICQQRLGERRMDVVDRLVPERVHLAPDFHPRSILVGIADERIQGDTRDEARRQAQSEGQRASRRPGGDGGSQDTGRAHGGHEQDGGGVAPDDRDQIHPQVSEHVGGQRGGQIAILRAQRLEREVRPRRTDVVIERHEEPVFSGTEPVVVIPPDLTQDRLESPRVADALLEDLSDMAFVGLPAPGDGFPLPRKAEQLVDELVRLPGVEVGVDPPTGHVENRSEVLGPDQGQRPGSWGWSGIPEPAARQQHGRCDDPPGQPDADPFHHGPLYRRFRRGIQSGSGGYFPGSNFLSSDTIVKSSPAARMVISDFTIPTFLAYHSDPSAACREPDSTLTWTFTALYFPAGTSTSSSPSTRYS